LEEVVVASVLLLVPVPVVLLLSALAVEAVAVGREIVTGEREVETTVVCWPALAARASSAELSRPRILDIAGNTSPAVAPVAARVLVRASMEDDGRPRDAAMAAIALAALLPSGTTDGGVSSAPAPLPLLMAPI
jgi:hypothetical protein